MCRCYCRVVSRAKATFGQRMHHLSQGRLRRPAQAAHTLAMSTQLALLARVDRIGRTLPTADEALNSRPE